MGKINREQALSAVKTLLEYVGEDVNREGLLGTPERVISSYEEHYRGYGESVEEVLGTTFDYIAGYNDIVLLKDIRFESTCEHHMAPIIGKAHVAYIPDGRVVGISKLARLVDIYAKRLQIQERLTNEIAQAIDKYLKPQGVVVYIKAEHHCMTARGVRKTDVDMITSCFLGCMKEDKYQQRFNASLNF